VAPESSKSLLAVLEGCGLLPMASRAVNVLGIRCGLGYLFVRGPSAK